MQTPTVSTDGVLLVYRFPLGGSREIHAYFQHHNGAMRAHLRLVTVKNDGSISFTPKGITVPLDALNELLKAAATLAVERERLSA